MPWHCPRYVHRLCCALLPRLQAPGNQIGQRADLIGTDARDLVTRGFGLSAGLVGVMRRCVERANEQYHARLHN